MGLDSGQSACLGLVILGVLAILTGSAAPFWLSHDIPGPEYRYGLWYWCIDDDCKRYDWEDFDADDYSKYFYAVHALAGLATLFAIITLFVSLCSMCQRGNSARLAGTLGVVCGMLGVAAGAVFYAEPERSLHISYGSKAWAFYVFWPGSFVAMVLGIILLAVSRNTSTPHTTFRTV